MKPSLDRPRLKVEWAHKHLEAFGSEYAAFLKRSEYRIIREASPQGEGEIARFSIREYPSPNLGLLLGDFAQNLRDALDHLAWQLALLKSDTPPLDTEFPIFFEDTPQGQRDIQKRTRGIPDAARDIIKGLQPYHRGDAARNTDLWILHRLANTSKHRLLLVIMEYVRLRVGFKGTTRGMELRLAGSFNDGDIIPLPFITRPFTEDMDFEIVPSFIIEFEEQRVGKKAMVTPAKLEGIYHTVRDNVLPRFAGFFS
jgi:hypothetical protein